MSFPDVPIIYSDLKRILRKGLSPDGRLYWWPLLVQISSAYGTSNATITASSYADPVSTAGRLVTMVGGDISDTLGNLIKKRNLNENAIPSGLVEIISEIIKPVDLQFLIISNIQMSEDRFNISNVCASLINTFVFKSILKEFMPKTFDCMMKIDALNDAHLAEIFSNYFLNMFPKEDVLIIMDAYLLEGIKILFRYGLALIRAFKSKIKSVSNLSGEQLWSSMRSDILNGTVSMKSIRSMAFESSGIIAIVTNRFMNISRANIMKLKGQAIMVVDVPEISSSPEVDTDSVEDRKLFLDSGSSILKGDMETILASYLPTAYSFSKFEVVFSSEQHGCSIETLYRKTEKRSSCILLTRAMNSTAVIGAFISCSLAYPTNEVRGDARTFVFRLDQGCEVKYPSVASTAHSEEEQSQLTSLHYHYATCTTDFMVVGSSATHLSNAIRIDSSLAMCLSGYSDTFGNPPLVFTSGDPHQSFPVAVVEVLCPKF